jgi:hypothetical protein
MSTSCQRSTQCVFMDATIQVACVNSTREITSYSSVNAGNQPVTVKLMFYEGKYVGDK